MARISQAPGCFCQRIYHLDIGNRREFNRRVFAARTFHTDSTCRYHNIAALYVQIHPAAGPDTHKRICLAAHQLLKRNHSRGAADPGRGNADFLPLEKAGIGDKFAAVCDLPRFVKMFRYFFAALRVAWQNHIPAHIARPDI